MKVRKGKEQFDLGLAVSALTLRYGQCRSHDELADFCGVTRRAIQKVEERALRKLRLRAKELE